MAKMYDVQTDKFREVTQEEFDELLALSKKLLEEAVRTDRMLSKMQEKLAEIVRRLKAKGLDS
jgi:DNA repair exonuclease SbcCD ATPase subunit